MPNNTGQQTQSGVVLTPQKTSIWIDGNILRDSNGSSIDLTDLINQNSEDDQELSLNGNILTIENGNQIELSTIETQNEDVNEVLNIDYLSIINSKR